VAWEVDLRLIEEWLDEQDKKTVVQILVALRELENYGPHLGRPLVDTIKKSSVKNLKELRPGSSGFSKIRILFVFDPARRAVMLVGGDKQNKWSRWYKFAIREAELRYERYLREMKDGER
jgi:hypothetical protein